MPVHEGPCMIFKITNTETGYSHYSVRHAKETPDGVKKWHHYGLSSGATHKIVESLRLHGPDAHRYQLAVETVFPNRAAAKEVMRKLIDADTISLGGTMNGRRDSRSRHPASL